MFIAASRCFHFGASFVKSEQIQLMIISAFIVRKHLYNFTHLSLGGTVTDIHEMYRYSESANLTVPIEMQETVLGHNMKYRYQELASQISSRIISGAIAPGERLPGVRKISQQYNISIATVISAYRVLEDEGYIEARPRSGYYVTLNSKNTFQEPKTTKGNLRPTAITGQDVAVQILTTINDPSIIQLGAAVPSGNFLPSEEIERSIVKAAKKYRVRNSLYEFPPGAPELRKQIALRMLGYGGNVHPDDIVITNGCQEAFQLALRSITNKGDVVAIESPTSHMILQVIESLGLKAIEVPTHPNNGISIEALEFVLQQWPIKACIVVSNYSNPLGHCMPDENKKAIVDLVNNYRIPLIEDDVYGDLGFNGRRPLTCKSFDEIGGVIYCSSFSKTLSPGLRIGWVVAGKYQKQIEYMKMVNSLASPTVTQIATSLFLTSGSYDRHIRKVRAEYAVAVERMTRAVEKYFPSDTKITKPTGGFVLWIELAKQVDAFLLSKTLFAHGISIAPGQIFSASRKYKNFIRISCSSDWGKHIDKALLQIVKHISANNGGRTK